MRRILSLLLLLFALTAQAQDSDADGKIMLTVILRHDQTLTLDEINDHLEKTGFRKTFPPDGVEIVSYNIVMGIGHIITLRLHPISSAKSISLSSMAFGAPFEQSSILPTITSKFFTTRKRRTVNLAQPVPPEKDRKTRRSRQNLKNPQPLKKSKEKVANENSTSPTHQPGSFCALPWNSGVWFRCRRLGF